MSREEHPALRASDAERDEVVVRLREASAEGRLTLEEFMERMAGAYEARTHAELEHFVARPSRRGRRAHRCRAGGRPGCCSRCSARRNAKGASACGGA